MPIRPPYPGTRAPSDELDHLRKGTREQYRSEWMEIPDTGSFAFTHTLGTIPWAVDVIRSESSEGDSPLDANSDVTVAKTDTTITVTNNTSITARSTYFRVRAM